MYQKIFWFICYNLIVVPPMFLVSLLLFPFVKKIRQGILGRVGLFKRLSQENFEKISKNKKIVWFHIASAGEFEQALPIISAVKNINENVFTLVTFFSPSGYNFFKKKSFSFIDYADYSPLDTPIAVIRFLLIVKPDILILTRYDIWPNMIWFSFLTRVKILMINGSLQKFSRRFKLIARLFYKSIYSCFKFIGTITDKDAKRFKNAVNDESIVFPVGDTKYDRVINRKSSQEYELDLNNILNEKTFIAASIWEEDEKVLFDSILTIYKKYKNKFTIIIVPHEPEANVLKRWEIFFNQNEISFVRFSDYDKRSNRVDALLVDRVGMLAELYNLSQIAYVGGGLSKGGVHNILEAAIYGNPTMFGNNFKNSYEARAFVKDKISIIIKNSNDISDYVLKLFDNDDELKKIGENHIEKVRSFCGASQEYLNFIVKFLH